MSNLKVTYAKIEFLNIDGAVVGFSRIRFGDAVMRQALGDTIGRGYSTEMKIPNSDKGDPRCYYALRMTLE